MINATWCRCDGRSAVTYRGQACRLSQVVSVAAEYSLLPLSRAARALHGQEGKARSRRLLDRLPAYAEQAQKEVYWADSPVTIARLEEIACELKRGTP